MSDLLPVIWGCITLFPYCPSLPLKDLCETLCWALDDVIVPTPIV